MKLKKILVYLSLLGIVVIAYFGFRVYQIVFVPNTQFSEKEVHVYIPTEATFEQVQEIVAPYLKDVSKFVALSEQRGFDTDIKPGKFLLTQGMHTHAIVSSMRKSIPVKVTFNNQERIEDLAGRISRQIEADSIGLLAAFREPSFLAEHGFTSETVFTLFIPNTFEFYWNTSAEKFRTQLTKEYYRFWNEERKAQAEAVGLLPVEVSILASIVQKETAKVDERPKVAQVYLNRLKVGMPLQADPTVIYAYKHNSNDFTQVIKRVYYKHLEVASPYNTYRNVGLPPGPIFMPDVSSIDAVLQPENHTYLYFCASVTRFGYHEFAENLAEHNINAKKYAAWLNAQSVAP